MLPSHSDLSYFLEVARTGNISRAAERLGLTQPSLSMALRRLESAVGASLLLRGKSGVELTPSGRFVAQRGHDLLQEWQGIRAGALSQAHSFAGRYTLGCHPAVARYTLPAFLPRLLERHPRIELQLEHDHSRKVTERVISRGLDLAIAVNPVSHPDLVIRELCRDRFTAWTREKGEGARPATLYFDPSLTQSQAILRKLEEGGLRFERQITSSELGLLAELARRGAGVALLPERVARGKGLKRLKLNSGAAPSADLSYDDRVCLVTRVDHPETAAFRAIVEAIRRAFRSPLPAGKDELLGNLAAVQHPDRPGRRSRRGSIGRR